MKSKTVGRFSTNQFVRFGYKFINRKYQTDPTTEEITMDFNCRYNS